MQEDAPLNEAEAALLALGQRLDWKRMGGSEFYHVAEVVGDGSSRYTLSLSESIEKWQARHIVNYRRPRGIADCPLFDSLADAKAACERHYATGQWD